MNEVQTNNQNFIQDRTISLIKDKLIKINLSNGISYYGKIFSYDAFSILFLPYSNNPASHERENKTIIIYKSSIASIEIYQSIEDKIDTTNPKVVKTNNSNNKDHDDKKKKIKSNSQTHNQKDRKTQDGTVKKDVQVASVIKSADEISFVHDETGIDDIPVIDVAETQLPSMNNNTSEEDNSISESEGVVGSYLEDMLNYNNNR